MGLLRRAHQQNRVDPIHFRLCEADFGQPKQSQSSQQDCRASLAMTSHSKKRKGAASRCPLFESLSLSPVASSGNLFVAGSGKLTWQSH